ncbi:response regulator receiver domain-containing protein [Paenibacillus sp. VMFN-D1]|nr:response regulator receiver domain-containing protein [Paenibacillus sp. VMFN-D1]
MKKVLVVDDELSISAAIAYALMREGFIVETAGDGEEALKKVSFFNPDVMILDVMLPKLSGYEVYRNLDVTTRPCVLLLSVRNNMTDKLQWLEEGADDYMTKPFDIREVVARVRALYRRSSRQSAANARVVKEK